MTLGVGGYIAGQISERGISSWQSVQVKAQQGIYPQIPKQ